MKLESLVIADQHAAVNTFPVLVHTARQTMEAGNARSRWHLQPDFMKLESLVIADQHAAVNTFPVLVHTARQTMEAGNARSRWHNP